MSENFPTRDAGARVWPRKIARCNLSAFKPLAINRGGQS
jgi:hypothetical protein